MKAIAFLRLKIEFRAGSRWTSIRNHILYVTE